MEILYDEHWKTNQTRSFLLSVLVTSFTHSHSSSHVVKRIYTCIAFSVGPQGVELLGAPAATTSAFFPCATQKFQPETNYPRSRNNCLFCTCILKYCNEPSFFIIHNGGRVTLHHCREKVNLVGFQLISNIFPKAKSIFLCNRGQMSIIIAWR